MKTICIDEYSQLFVTNVESTVRYKITQQYFLAIMFLASGLELRLGQLICRCFANIAVGFFRVTETDVMSYLSYLYIRKSQKHSYVFKVSRSFKDFLNF